MRKLTDRQIETILSILRPKSVPAHYLAKKLLENGTCIAGNNYDRFGDSEFLFQDTEASLLVNKENAEGFLFCSKYSIDIEDFVQKIEPLLRSTLKSQRDLLGRCLAEAERHREKISAIQELYPDDVQEFLS